MAVNIAGLVSIIVFYVIILVIGIIASRKAAKSTAEEVLVAGRRMGLIVSFFTLTASQVGGAFINGTAEIMASSGIVWAQAPLGYCISMTLAGLFYAPPMRRAGYVTLFDPFQMKYGNKIGTLMIIPQFFGDLFWTAAILSALGSTVAIILDIDQTISIIGSACVAIIYTLFGGLWSVAYTDVIQLICIAIGLVVAVPFAMTHESVSLDRIKDTWRGEIPNTHLGTYIDIWCLLLFGGISWQEYFQRALACKTVQRARVSSMVGSVGMILFAIPSGLMGVAGSAADWNSTAYNGTIPIPAEKMSYILPLVLQYLCPLPVSIIGMGAIAAAVMSSADSSILSTASVFARNIYVQLIRPKASDREIIWVVRVMVLVAGGLGTALAITANTVYGLLVLCGDLMYVILFPQLTCLLFFEVTNGYGAVFGFFLSFILRILGGEPQIHLPPTIHYPFYTDEFGQNFPFRTLTMLLSFICILLISKLTYVMFTREWVPKRFDILECSDPSYRQRLRKNTLAKEENGEEMRELNAKSDHDSLRKRPTDSLLQSEISR